MVGGGIMASGTIYAMHLGEHIIIGGAAALLRMFRHRWCDISRPHA
jgi:hypothetical protein